METNEDKFPNLREEECVRAVRWIHNLPYLVYVSVALHNYH